MLKKMLLASVVALGMTGAAHAVPFSSTGALGAFAGNLTYTAGTNTTATLSLSLTNTTAPASRGGYITAFVLNNPGNLITNINSFTDAPGGGSFSLLGLSNGGVNGAPNGQFDFGASTGGSFEGGGPPQNGIGVGASDSFTFSLTGNNLQSLTADSFLTALSTGTGGGDGYAAVSVRFRGFQNGGSDKVTYTGLTPINPVPEPASMALLGAGLVGLGFARRRRSKA